MLNLGSPLWPAILWPFAGAIALVATGRLWPGWVRRLTALAVSLASFLHLWSLRTSIGDKAEIFWEPLNFFRTGLAWRVDGLSLLTGLSLAVLVAMAVLVERGSESGSAEWTGLLLAVLAGALAMGMGANLLALALGSGWIDLVLIVMALAIGGDTGRVLWRVAVPGVASTLVLIAGAVQMSAQVGTVSLAAQNIPVQMVAWLSVAGMLRLMVFPIHPRGVHHPQTAIPSALAIGVGGYLLARAQAIAPGLGGYSGMLRVGIMALLAGGILAWTGLVGSARRPDQAQDEQIAAEKDGGSQAFLLGVVVHQTGWILIVVSLLRGGVAWVVSGVVLALAVLTLWEGRWQVRGPAPWLSWGTGISRMVHRWWDRVVSGVAAGFVEAWRRRARSWLRGGAWWVPTVALASMAGFPLTAGALGRWSAYGALLREGKAGTLIAVLVADTFLMAGLWLALRRFLERAGQPVRASFVIAGFVLDALVLVIGIASGSLSKRLSIEPVPGPGVSVWGLGLVYGLPWLVGGWLAYAGSRWKRILAYGQRIVGLNWLFEAASWLGRQAVHGLHWLGQVGEGEGWLGWALILLILGGILFLAR